MKPHPLLAAVVTLVASATASAQPKVIYGDDDRLDLFQVTDANMLRLADSTVALFVSDDVTLDPATGNFNLATRSYQDELDLCADEPFLDQKQGPICSGTLVGPDLVLTAGHCMMDEPGCAGFKFVFGFGIKNSGDPTPSSVPASEVYSCASIVGQSFEMHGADFAVIRLDRPVVGHAPLAINRTGAIVNGTPLAMIGHPSSLPTKIAAGANVRDAQEKYFVANLDAFGGNSGSGVFNTETGLIEGILSSGEMDFTHRIEEDKDEQDGISFCRASFRCPDDGCLGESVSKVIAASPFIPLLPGEPEPPAPTPTPTPSPSPDPAPIDPTPVPEPTEPIDTLAP